MLCFLHSSAPGSERLFNQNALHFSKFVYHLKGNLFPVGKKVTVGKGALVKVLCKTYETKFFLYSLRKLY